jgi:hypothetical protein
MLYIDHPKWFLCQCTMNKVDNFTYVYTYTLHVSDMLTKYCLLTVIDMSLNQSYNENINTTESNYSTFPWKVEGYLANNRLLKINVHRAISLVSKFTVKYYVRNNKIKCLLDWLRDMSMTVSTTTLGLCNSYTRDVLFLNLTSYLIFNYFFVSIKVAVIHSSIKLNGPVVEWLPLCYFKSYFTIDS